MGGNREVPSTNKPTTDNSKGDDIQSDDNDHDDDNANANGKKQQHQT